VSHDGIFDPDPGSGDARALGEPPRPYTAMVDRSDGRQVMGNRLRARSSLGCVSSPGQPGRAASRRRGGRVGGGCRRGGNWAKSSVVASCTRRTARSTASSVRGEGDWTPLTLRTYWRAAASISWGVASGSSPRRVVMFRHMDRRLRGADPFLPPLVSGWLRTPPGSGSGVRGRGV
jgi:hypothetical protein